MTQLRGKLKRKAAEMSADESEAEEAHGHWTAAALYGHWTDITDPSRSESVSR